MFSFLSKTINEVRKNIRLSFTKSKEFKDSIINITKLIEWQIKLVDTILQRDKNSYTKNNLKLKSILDDFQPLAKEEPIFPYPNKIIFFIFTSQIQK